MSHDRAMIDCRDVRAFSPLTPSPGTPGEGGGGGFLLQWDRARVRFVTPLASLFVVLFTSVAHAAATEEEVFRSIHNNVTQTPQSGKVFAVLLAGIVVAGVLIFVSTRAKREATPKALNHQGKLLKEVQKTVPLSASAVKSLKRLAEEKECVSPLTLLLCPSLRQGQEAKPTAPAHPSASPKAHASAKAGS